MRKKRYGAVKKRGLSKAAIERAREPAQRKATAETLQRLKEQAESSGQDARQCRCGNAKRPASAVCRACEKRIARKTKTPVQPWTATPPKTAQQRKVEAVTAEAKAVRKRQLEAVRQSQQRLRDEIREMGERRQSPAPEAVPDYDPDTDSLETRQQRRKRFVSFQWHRAGRVGAKAIQDAIKATGDVTEEQIREIYRLECRR